MDSSFNVAVHALVYLHHKDCLLSSEALAENICTNPARVRKVMAALRRAGLVDSREGNVGGYRFGGYPDRITLGQVAKALDIRFVDAAWRSGDSDMECLVASGMAGLMDEIFDDLNEQCRKRLKEITIGTLDHRIFGNQNKER